MIEHLILHATFYNHRWIGVNDISQFYHVFLPWAYDQRVGSIRFEDLIGEQGGGGKKAQYEVIKKVAQHLGIRVDKKLFKSKYFKFNKLEKLEIGYLNKKMLQKIENKLFGGTYTFRKGQIGEWQEYFTDYHKTIFKKVGGQLLIDLGYENDLRW